MNKSTGLVSRSAVIFSLKMFLASILAWWISLRFGLEKPYWAIGTVYIVSSPLSGVSSSKALYRLLGTLLGGIAAVVLIPNLVSSPELLSLTVALWVGGCLFISQFDRTPRSYVFMLAGYTVCLAGLPNVTQPENTFLYAVARVQEIGIGVICAAVVSRVVFPSHAGPVLHGRVMSWLDNAARLTAETLSGRAEMQDGERAQRQLAADAVDMRGFTTHIGYDTSHHRDLMQMLTALQRRMIELLPPLSGLADQLSALRASDCRSDRLDDLVQRTVDWIEAPGNLDIAAGEQLKVEAQALEIEGSVRSGWDGNLITNAAYRLGQTLSVWQDCAVLQGDLSSGSLRSERARQILAAMPEQASHVDVGRAALAGLSATVSILIASAFWISTGWSAGLGLAEFSGVYCCILAMADNIVPALRKFLILVIYATILGGIAQFAILPFLTGFWPLVACFGLILIPTGILMATPRTFMIGLALGLNFVFVVMPTPELSLNFQSFLENNISSALAIVVAIVGCGLVRSLGAETWAKWLVRNAWGRIVGLVNQPTPASHVRLAQQLIDILGQIAPRLAGVPEGSKIRAVNLLRDLRAGLNVTDIRELRDELSPQAVRHVDVLLAAISDYYTALRGASGATPERIIRAIDDCLSDPACFPEPTTATDTSPRDLQRALVALRLCLAPDLPAPERVVRISSGYAGHKMNEVPAT